MTLPNAIPGSSPSPDRRLDLDWLRIAAFGLLIFYHVGMFYVSWGFHVKSSHAGPAAEPLMQLLNPWRLALLFVISGCATRFMLDKIATGAFVASRTTRLLVPLVFCMFVIVPPQTYYEVVEKLGFSGSPFEFYGKYVTASGDWEIITPTWNHLWFVAYLFVYTLLIVAIGPMVKRLPAPWLAPLTKGWPIIVLPFVWLLLTRVTLEPIFDETHALYDDWYAHTVYFPAFLFGYAIAKHEAFFAFCQRARWPLLCVALASWAALQGVRLTLGSMTGSPGPMLALAGTSLRELQAWTMILALFGFARRHLRHDNAARRYLTDAIFPFYIIHQTTIVIAGFHLDKLGWPLWIEVPLLIGVTAASCWLGYEIVRRVGFLRPLFGLKPLPRRRVRQAATA